MVHALRSVVVVLFIGTLSAALAGGLAGCASTPTAQAQGAPERMLRDEHFPPNQDHIDPNEALALSPAMREFIRTRLSVFSKVRDQRDALLDALYTRGDLRLEYDAERTRTAAEAFEARTGNCLSLTLMTAAFARAIGLPVSYRHIYQEEQWSRVGDLQVVSGHVNLGLSRQPTAYKVLGGGEPMLVVDFLPGAEIRTQRATELDEDTIVAMYLNNRAAEWMALGQVDRAYWWARAAWLQSPRLLSALNTLGVVYRRHGDVAAAEAAFREVLRRESGNVQAMSNLAQLLRHTDRLAEAEQWEARLAVLQPYPPFKFFDMGIAAMHAGDYARARDLFTREIDRSAYYHEFYFWLALSNVGLRHWDEVRQALAKAQEVSTTVNQRQLYAAKLASLKARTVAP
ncbi:tetratricopeptide repeat protein [Roseateles amylovorans]|uniref:Tetratricopeptide repeat protein n=1 Tax=Roseateles amylovorans TaxID=2978473 RepID=A0ABY6AVE1_9BURK|nr:tetratricopeptide repeat protein [Roseateles amylovorans]UXH76344.1 tetratricopeptide repeat protein [Roseateles amylovorans]